MASIEMNNSITTLIRDLEMAAERIPELRKKILNAEADVVEPALRAAISAAGLIDTGTLHQSIGRSFRKNSTELLVGPSGVHHKWFSPSGPVGELRSGHLGYIYEYGAPLRGIRARHWMSKAVGSVTGRAMDAAFIANDTFWNNYDL